MHRYNKAPEYDEDLDFIYERIRDKTLEPFVPLLTNARHGIVRAVAKKLRAPRVAYDSSQEPISQPIAPVALILEPVKALVPEPPAFMLLPPPLVLEPPIFEPQVDSVPSGPIVAATVERIRRVQSAAMLTIGVLIVAGLVNAVHDFNRQR